MPNLLLLSAFSVVNLLLVGYIAWDHYSRNKKTTQEPKITTEVLTQIIEDALNRLTTQKLGEGSAFFTEKLEKDYQQSLSGALAEVQKEESKLTAEATQQFVSLEAGFKDYLTSLEGSVKSHIEQTNQKVALAEQNYEKFLQNLVDISQKTQLQSIEGAKIKVDKLFEDFEVKLADFLLQSEQKMMLAVDLELRSARQLIDTYKVQQMNVIDENIMAMLEKTLSLVLAKNLDLKDQMDLVYESLEKAKAEKFVV
jgi:uncharacterized membrane protein